MTNELKEKLNMMSEQELRDILNNESLYNAQAIEFVKQLLEEDEISEDSNLSGEDNQTEESKSNEKKQTKYYNPKVIATIVVVIVAVALSSFVIIYNHHKTTKQNAIIRINSICDEITSLPIESDYSQLLAFDSKISEIEMLMNNTNLDNIYVDRCTQALNYLNDLKLYNEITKALLNNDKQAWMNIQININNLKTERVRSKITPEVVEQIRQVCEDWLIFNSLKYFEKHVIKVENFENVLTGICNSYCATFSDYHKKTFLMSVPDNFNVQNMNYISYGSITSKNSDFLDVYWSDRQVGQKNVGSVAVKKAISENANKIFIVEYVNSAMDDMYRYVCNNSNVTAIYENGILELYKGIELFYLRDLKRNLRLFTL